MFAVVAVYPSGHQVLVGFAHSQADVDSLVDDACKANGGREALIARGIHFNVELAC